MLRDYPAFFRANTTFVRDVSLILGMAEGLILFVKEVHLLKGEVS